MLQEGIRRHGERILLRIDIHQQTAATVEHQSLERALIEGDEKHTHQNQHNKGEEEIEQKTQRPGGRIKLSFNQKKGSDTHTRGSEKTGAENAQTLGQRRMADNALIGAEHPKEQRRKQ